MLKVHTTLIPQTPVAEIYYNKLTQKTLIRGTVNRSYGNNFEIETGFVTGQAKSCDLKLLGTTENFVVTRVANEFTRYSDVQPGSTFLHNGNHYFKTEYSAVRLDTGEQVDFFNTPHTATFLTDIELTLA